MGCLPQCMLGRHPCPMGRHPPWAPTPGQTPPTPWQTPPLGRHLPGQIPPPADNPLGRQPLGQTPPSPANPPPGRHPPTSRRLLLRTVRILLECILVSILHSKAKRNWLEICAQVTKSNFNISWNIFHMGNMFYGLSRRNLRWTEIDVQSSTSDGG